MLMIAVFCTLLLIVLILLVLFAAINLKITYRNGKVDLELSVFGSPIWFKLSGFLEKRLKAQKDKSEKSEEKDGDKNLQKQKKTLDGINDAFDFVSKFRRIYVRSRRFVRKRFCIKQLNVCLEYSMADAALTAITAGTLWTLLYRILGLMTTIARVDGHDFSVKPVYEEHFMFDVDIECILKFRIANIIGILLCLLYNHKKSRKE